MSTWAFGGRDLESQLCKAHARCQHPGWPGPRPTPTPKGLGLEAALGVALCWCNKTTAARGSLSQSAVACGALPLRKAQSRPHHHRPCHSHPRAPLHRVSCSYPGAAAGSSLPRHAELPHCATLSHCSSPPLSPQYTGLCFAGPEHLLLPWSPRPRCKHSDTIPPHQSGRPPCSFAPGC